MASGLEQGGWGLGRVSKGLGGWGLEGGWDLRRVSKGLGSWGLEEGWGLEEAGGLGGGWSQAGRTFVRSLVRSFARSFVRSFARTDGNYPPLFYRTSSPSGPLPKNRTERSQN